MGAKVLYQGRIRIFDPEPGSAIYLLDHADAEGDWGPDLADVLERQFDGLECVGPPFGPVRITVELVDEKGAEAAENGMGC